MASTSLDDLVEPLRSAVKGLVAEAGPGVVTWTGTRRTRAEQAALRIKNGCPDVMTAPASACRIPTAIPGTSKHETGQAIDFTNTDAVLSVVERLAPKYGIVPTVAGERWHYEHAGRATAAPTTPASSTPPAAGGGSSVGDLFGLLSSGRFWLRVLTVLLGAGLTIAGLAVLGFDLSTPAAVGA